MVSSGVDASTPACLSATWSCPPRISTGISDYEADATDYEFTFNQNAIAYDSPIYDFGGDPRGFATNHEETHITTVEARLSSRTDSDSRWAWIVGAFYSQEGGKTAFDSFVRGYENTPSFEYFDAYEQASRAIRSRRPNVGSSDVTTPSWIRPLSSAS